MISYILSVTGAIPEAIGAVCSALECAVVVILCIVRILKLIAQIKAIRSDDNPNDAQQIKDAIDETIKDLKNDVKNIKGDDDDNEQKMS